MAHEELRDAQSSLKQAQDQVKKLEKIIAEKESQVVSVEETLGKTIKDLEVQVQCYVITENKTAFNVLPNTGKNPK